MIALFLVVFGLTAIGCDALTPGGPSYAGGVVDAETGQAVEGIQLALKVSSGGFGNATTVAATLTDARGRFRLSDPQDRSSRSALYVNAPGFVGEQPNPYNPVYQGGLVDYDYDDRHDIRVELRRL